MFSLKSCPLSGKEILINVLTGIMVSLKQNTLHAGENTYKWLPGN